MSKRESEQGRSPEPKKGRGDQDEVVDLELEGSSDVLEGAVTLSAIRGLLKEELSTVKDSVEKLASDLGIFKTRMNDELCAMGLRLKGVEDKNAQLYNRMEELQKMFETFKVDTKVDCEKQINEIKGLRPSNNKDGIMTVVIGNIPNTETLEQAKEWLRKKCLELGTAQPIDAFSKGDFKGMLFAKFQSVAQRDVVIAGIRSSTTSTSHLKTWAKIDSPLDVRTAEGVLFGFKRMLVDWKFNKNARSLTQTCVFSKLQASRSSQLRLNSMPSSSCGAMGSGSSGSSGRTSNRHRSSQL